VSDEHARDTASMDDELALMCAGVRIRETNDLAEEWIASVGSMGPLLLMDATLSHSRRAEAYERMRRALERLRR
jgi:hypothetical protein